MKILSINSKYTTSTHSLAFNIDGVTIDNSDFSNIYGNLTIYILDKVLYIQIPSDSKDIIMKKYLDEICDRITLMEDTKDNDKISLLKKIVKAS